MFWQDRPWSRKPRGQRSAWPPVQVLDEQRRTTPHASAPWSERRLPRRLYRRMGNLEVRLVRATCDIRQAQRLRYQVFYEELSAKPSPTAALRRRDADGYDAICDHFIVYDTAPSPALSASGLGPRKAQAVGTYRVLRQEMAARSSGFYTQGEYDIAPLLARHSAHYQFMELGRSCVLAPYRTKRTIELLWHGLWAYAREHRIDVMIGCASFDGVDPAKHAMALGYLHRDRLAPPAWRARAHPPLYVGMDQIAPERIDARLAVKQLPPLIKAYLRLGAWVGDGAVVDRQFGTTDVLIILPVENINARYFDYFGAPDEAP